MTTRIDNPIRTNGVQPSPFPRLLAPFEVPPAINWPNDKEQLTWIYGLSDPRNGNLCVIGRSVMPQKAGSLDSILGNGNEAIRDWARSLADNYRIPITHLLACGPKDWADDVKHLYINAAIQLGAPLLSRPVDPWRVSYDVRMQISATARWVLTHAYPSLAPCHLPMSQPCYDDTTCQRIARRPLSSADWRQLQETQDEDRDADLALEWAIHCAWGKGTIEGGLAWRRWLGRPRQWGEPQGEFDYRIGVLQAEELDLPLIDGSQP